MRILILGGSGFIGCSIAKQLTLAGTTPIVGSRNPSSAPGVETITIDAQDTEMLSRTMRRADAIVNCVMGSEAAIVGGATVMAAVLKTLRHRPRLVHLSTMSVYGSQEGLIGENADCIADIGWYGAAKIRAEQLLHSHALGGGALYILRPGCVYGPGSALWTNRIAALLRARRLGDLGANGDGWSNLVHVDDVARAVVHCLLDAPAGSWTYNLADPEAPRWNAYFRDLALAIGAVPLRYFTRRRLAAESLLAAPLLKVAERMLTRCRVDHRWLPEAMPPSLLRLWRQQIRLDSRAIELAFDLRWTPYETTLQQCAAAFAAAPGCNS